MNFAHEIRSELNSLRDEEYRAFQSKLIPTVPADRFIGVRTPALRALAKRLAKREEKDSFLIDLPHKTFDEDQLHAFLLSEEKDFDRCVAGVEAFLPYVDNWATCDQLRTRSFAKRKADLLPFIDKWMASGETYAVRFGIGMLMTHFLDGAFDPAYLQKVASVSSEEYYVNMMRAWYFATALAKHPDETSPFLEKGKLDEWTRKKAVQKARESFRVSDEWKKRIG